VMSGQVGSADSEPPAGTKPGAKPGAQGSASSSGASSSSTAGGGEAPPAGPIIKAGTIFYAVLDTEVNSDFPDSPVLATIVSGKYKGAKLLGKLAVTQGQDRVSLTFKLMNMDEWQTGKSVNAFAIDPDTARTVLASSVNYHYFMRYGGQIAASFISGYANAIGSSGATTSLSVTGSTTTNPVLSPSSKLISGLGEVGKTLGKSAQTLTDTPPTVKIDPGVSLGILFMADVTG
jgi:intracellular multiplication protein IcmE